MRPAPCPFPGQESGCGIPQHPAPPGTSSPSPPCCKRQNPNQDRAHNGQAAGYLTMPGEEEEEEGQGIITARCPLLPTPKRAAGTQRAGQTGGSGVPVCCSCVHMAHVSRLAWAGSPDGRRLLVVVVLVYGGGGADRSHFTQGEADPAVLLSP